MDKYLQSIIYIISTILQASIPVGCVPPAWKPYVSVATIRCHSWDGDPQVKKFEDVSSEHHLMSLALGTPADLSPWVPHLAFPGERVGTCVSSDGHQMSLRGGWYL